MRIALFGGSFDPPHLGHVLCAAYAFAVGRVDRLWVLPAAEHPYGKPISPWEQRWRLCQAAFAGLGFVEIKEDELRNPGGYTVNLVEALRTRFPDHRWLLVGGTDTARDLVNWHRGADLAALVEVIAVPRQGYDNGHPAALPAISSSQVRERLKRSEPVADLLPAAVYDLIQREDWYR